jgi:hypothetical protein
VRGFNAARITLRYGWLLTTLWVVATAHGESLSGKELVSALRAGGYVILMRHVSSPRTPPDRAQANADNVQHERQLDAEVIPLGLHPLRQGRSCAEGAR